MDLNRAESDKISHATRQLVLSDYDLVGERPLAIGTEAEVYAVDDEHVLKLYADVTRLKHIESLRAFYGMLDTDHLSFAIPRIETIKCYDDVIAVLERRIAGVTLESKIPHLDQSQHRRAEDLYLDAAFRIRDLTITIPPTAYLLFDDRNESGVHSLNFNAFYASLLDNKIRQVHASFARSLSDFNTRASRLVSVIRNNRQPRLAVVHGDFFPGNVLVDDKLTRIQGIIDFGSFTMFGDYLIDIAGAFSYYRMYDPERHVIRQRMRTRILERLTLDEQPRFFQYVLANAIITSNLYATDRPLHTDDHFRWANEIVTDDDIWKYALA